MNSICQTSKIITSSKKQPILLSTIPELSIFNIFSTKNSYMLLKQRFTLCCKIINFRKNIDYKTQHHYRFKKIPNIKIIQTQVQKYQTRQNSTSFKYLSYEISPSKLSPSCEIIILFFFTIYLKSTVLLHELSYLVWKNIDNLEIGLPPNFQDSRTFLNYTFAINPSLCLNPMIFNHNQPI